jgi:hypothetical protein
MWALLVVFSMVAATGAVLVAQQAHDPVLQQAQDDSRARNFALYRSFVVQHAAQNPGVLGTVPDSALPLPHWFQRDPSWTNEVLAGGQVLVYRGGGSSATLLAQLETEAHESLLVGEALRRPSGQTYLFSPRFGDTGIDLPALPSGTVVWLARLN